MNDLLRKKIDSNPELKRKIDQIVLNNFPILPEGVRIELFDLNKNKIVLQKIRQEVMKLNGLTQNEKDETAEWLPKLYIDSLNDHNKKLDV